MSKRRGRKRTINRELVISYAQANPTTYQSDIATYFGIGQKSVSRVLRDAGMIGFRRGRAPKRKPEESELEHTWEQILHDHGLGMDRGARIKGQRYFSFDATLERMEDESATMIQTY